MDKYIDIYCERLEPGLWAEPLNVVTNLSFFIAGFFAYLLARQENALDWRSVSLIALTIAMGIGSTLFHAYATVWTMLSDVLPILAYQIVFIIVYTRYVIGLNCLKSASILGLFFIAMYVSMQLPREWLNGSLEYAPALLFVLGLGIYHYLNAERERYGLLLAGFVFIVSLAFRSIDMALCDHIAFGTHFMWHILNGLVLYLTTRAFVLNSKQ